MGVGAGLYMCDVVVKKFTFAISSPDEFLCYHVVITDKPRVVVLHHSNVVACCWRMTGPNDCSEEVVVYLQRIHSSKMCSFYKISAVAEMGDRGHNRQMQIT